MDLGNLRFRHNFLNESKKLVFRINESTSSIKAEVSFPDPGTDFNNCSALLGIGVQSPANMHGNGGFFFLAQSVVLSDHQRILVRLLTRRDSVLGGLLQISSPSGLEFVEGSIEGLRVTSSVKDVTSASRDASSTAGEVAATFSGEPGGQGVTLRLPQCKEHEVVEFYLRVTNPTLETDHEVC
jgi:hypothetical protein